MDGAVIGVLKYALAREKEGEKFYRERTQNVFTPQVRDILEELAEMEKDHVLYIETLIESLIKGAEFTHYQLENPGIFKKREVLELKGISIDNIAGDISILRMAYLIENDFAEFYEKSARNTESKDLKEILEKLSKWETEHRRIVQSIYDDLTKEYWNFQGFTPLY